MSILATAPSWGHRFVSVMSILGLDFGTDESTEWAMLRDHHRSIRWNPQALAAANADQDWPPLRDKPAPVMLRPIVEDQGFKIELADGDVCEVRTLPDGNFGVVIMSEDDEYVSAVVPTFVDAVKNAVGPVWNAHMPF